MLGLVRRQLLKKARPSSSPVSSSLFILKHHDILQRVNALCSERYSLPFSMSARRTDIEEDPTEQQTFPPRSPDKEKARKSWINWCGHEGMDHAKTYEWVSRIEMESDTAYNKGKAEGFRTGKDICSLPML